MTTGQAWVNQANADVLDDNESDDDTSGDQLRPFIRWVGGKRIQAPMIAAWCVERLARTRGARYIEPFLGGGAVALTLPPGTPMILADLCRPLGWLWWWVQQEPAAVAEYAAGFGVDSEDGWNTAEGFAQARIDHNSQPFAEEDYTPSARFLWLLHAAYNGLYRENATGLFNVAWGKRTRVTVPTAAHLIAVSERLANAEIRPGWDFEAVIDGARAGDVVYADPPYDGDPAAFVNYASKFIRADQARLAEAIERAARRGVHVITTNADTERVRQLYSWMTVEEIGEQRKVAPTANGRGVVSCLRMTTP